MSIETKAWFQNTDGTLRSRRRGPEVVLLAAELHWALLTVQSALGLDKFKYLKRVSLKGRHFAMRRVDIEDLTAISTAGELESLALNGALLDASTLNKALEHLTGIEELDVRGLAVNNQVLSTIVRNSPHLRSLLVGWAKQDGEHAFAPFDLGPSVLAETLPLKNLQVLAVRGLSITDADIVEQPLLSQLTDIDIADTAISSRGLRHLGDHGKLRRIVMDNCPIDDSCAPTLKANSDLQALSAERTRISDATLAVLGDLTHLTDLNVTATRGTNAGLAKLIGLPNLRRLKARNTRFSSSAIAELVSQTPSLQSLSVGGTVFSPAELSTFEFLDELELGILPDPAAFSALAGLPGEIDLLAFDFPPGNPTPPEKLRDLQLGTPLRAEIVRSIAPLQSLRDLLVRGEAHFLSELRDGDLKGLRNLYAQGAQFNNAALMQVAHLPSLEALYISGNPIDEASVAALEAKPYLHTLELRSVALDSSVVDTLLTLPSLHCLDLPGTGLTPGSIARLGRAPTLQSLAIDAGQLTEESIEGLAALPTLMELYLYGDGYTIETFTLLERLPYLTEIVFLSNSQFIDSEAVPAFANIARLRHLKGAIDDNARAQLLSARPDIHINRVSSIETSGEELNSPMTIFPVRARR